MLFFRRSPQLYARRDNCPWHKNTTEWDEHWTFFCFVNERDYTTTSNFRYLSQGLVRVSKLLKSLLFSSLSELRVFPTVQLLMLAQHIYIHAHNNAMRFEWILVLSSPLDLNMTQRAMRFSVTRSEYEKFEETKYELRAIHRVKSRVYMEKRTLCTAAI